MFGRRYFGGAYFGARYFGDGAADGGGGASAGAVWAYMLSNGKSAGQNLVEINAGIAELLARNCFDEPIAGAFTAGDILRILAAIQAGKSHITRLGSNAAQVSFEAIDDSGTTVSAEMNVSQRTTVTLNP